MLIEIRELTKVYRMGETEVHALAGVSVDIDAGEFVAVMVRRAPASRRS